jgi:mono/diheme cytochrome c family protein
VDGEQYVTVLAGWGGAIPLVAGEVVQEAAKGGTNCVLTFKLGGKASLPALPSMARTLAPPPATASKDTVDRGRALYQQYCAACHGDTASAGGVLPDLRYSALLGAAPEWKAIVLDGTRVRNGMVSFSRYLKPDEVEIIRAYVIQRAHDEQKRRAAGG